MILNIILGLFLIMIMFFFIYVVMENLPRFLENLSETIREYDYLKENIREIKELKKQRKIK